MIYLHYNYKKLVRYEFVKNNYKIVEYDTKLDKITQGFFDILGNKYIAIFAYNGILYLSTQTTQISFNNLNIDLLSKDLNQDIIERKLIIKENNKIVDEITYTINKLEITQQIQYTEMAEVEDFDFGLRIIHIYDDKERQKRFLNRVKEKK